MPVPPSKDEIYQEIDGLDPDAAAGGRSKYPGMTWEQGVSDALMWAAGDTDQKPVTGADG